MCGIVQYVQMNTMQSAVQMNRLYSLENLVYSESFKFDGKFIYYSLVTVFSIYILNNYDKNRILVDII